MIRWTLRIFIAVAILLAILALGVQLVLSTDLPRQQVLAVLERETGLRVEAADLNTGWGGGSDVTDLRVFLPLADEPFLTAAAVRVSHAGLIKLTLLRDLDLRSVEIERPVLTLREQDRREWNIVRAIDLIRRRQDRGEPGGNPPRLPAVRVADGTIRVLRGGEEVMTTPLTFVGEPDGTTSWKFEAHLGPGQWARGRLSPGGDWEHEVEFEGERVESLLAPFLDAEEATPADGEPTEPEPRGAMPVDAGAGRRELAHARPSVARAPAFGLLALAVPIEAHDQPAAPRHDESDNEQPQKQDQRQENAPPDAAAGSGRLTDQPMRARGRWRGRLTPGGITGRVELDELEVGEHRAVGEADVFYKDGDIRVDADGVDIQTPLLPQGPLRVVHGDIRREGELLVIEDAAVEVLGIHMEAFGRWDQARRRGEFSAFWSGETPELGLRYDGQAEATISTPQGRPRVDALIETGGVSAVGRWEAQIEARARGSSWTQLDVSAHAPQLIWIDEQGVVDLAGLRLHGGVRDDLVELTSLMLPGAGTAAAIARFDRSSKAWSLDFAATNWQVPRLNAGPIDAAIRASGDALHADIAEFRLDAGPLSAHAAGEYVPGRDIPLQASGELTYAGADVAGEGVPGQWRAALQVAGDLRPADVSFNGEVVGERVPVAAGRIDRVVIPVDGKATDQIVAVKTGEFALLDGRWRLDARFTADDRLATVHVQPEGVPIQALLDLLDAPVEMPGELAANVEARLPELDLDQIEVGGSWEVGSPSFRQFAADTARGRIATRDGVVRLEDVVIARGPGELSGSLEFNLSERRHLLLDMTASDWLVKLEESDAGVVLDGRAQLDIDVVELAGQGRVEAAGEVVVGDRLVGDFAVEGDVVGRTLAARRIEGNLPSGTIRGSGTFPLDDWPRTRAELRLDNVQLAELAQWAGTDEHLTGVVTGTIKAAPNDDPKALEPLQIDVAIETLGGSYRALRFGDARMTVFAGPTRLFVQESRFDVAGGSADLWLRLSRHGDEPFVHLVTDLHGLEVNEFVQSAAPGSDPILGRLSGRAALGGYIHYPHRAFGQGQLTLVESDLANVPFIAMIYNLLNLGSAGRDARGRGVVEFRLEGDTLDLTRLQYFNRGADIIADLSIRNIWLGAESPIEGLAAGAIRPLRDIDLPLFSDLDRLVNALQAKAVSVHIGGTLGAVRTSTVPFEEVSGTIVRILGRSPRE